MASDKITFQTYFNNAISGLFKTNTTKDIGSVDFRELVDEIMESVPFSLDDSYTWASPTGNSAGTNSYTSTLVPAVVAYTSDLTVKVRFFITSTNVCTLNLNGVGAKKIFISPTVQANANDILANQIYILVYDTNLDSANGGFLLIGSKITHARGAFNATGTDVYPAAGTGSGPGGDILAGDWWHVSVSGDNTDFGGTLPTRIFFTALVNTPGTTSTNWRIH